MKYNNQIIDNLFLVVLLIFFIFFLISCNTITGTARGFGKDIKNTFNFFGIEKNNEN